LQILQDEYGCALDIPLRIYNLSNAKTFWEKKYHILSERFDTQEKFHSYVKDLTSSSLEDMVIKLKHDNTIWETCLSHETEKSCWLTDHSMF